MDRWLIDTWRCRICGKPAYTGPNMGEHPNYIRSWDSMTCKSCENKAFAQSQTQQQTTQQTQQNTEIERLKKEVEQYKSWWYEKTVEVSKLNSQVSQLQTAKTTAERERDTAKSNLTQEKNAHQQTRDNLKNQFQKTLDQLKSINLDDYQKLTKQKNGNEGKTKDKTREWREIYFNEKYIGKENKEFNLLTFYKDSLFNYLWEGPVNTVTWIRKADLLSQDGGSVFNPTYIPNEFIENQKDKQQLEQKYTQLTSEHNGCQATIQALEKEKKALAQQLNELITGIPQGEEVDERVMMRTATDSQLEAKVVQPTTNLPPK